MKDLYIAVLTVLCGQLAIFVKTLYGDRKLYRRVVRDLATNHLNHIYHAQKLMAAKLGIELGDPPPAEWASKLREE